MILRTFWHLSQDLRSDIDAVVRVWGKYFEPLEDGVIPSRAGGWRSLSVGSLGSSSPRFYDCLMRHITIGQSGHPCVKTF
jgi:hypothetical protein